MKKAMVFGKLEGVKSTLSRKLSAAINIKLCALDLIEYKQNGERVPKRLLKSFFVKPEGWPDGSSVLKGTLANWKYLRLSPMFWAPELFKEIQLQSEGKEIYRVTLVNELNNFVYKFGEHGVSLN